MKTFIAFLICALAAIMVGASARQETLTSELSKSREESAELRRQRGFATAELPPPQDFRVITVVDPHRFIAQGDDGEGSVWKKFFFSPNHGFVEGDEYAPFFLQRTGYVFKPKK